MKKPKLIRVTTVPVSLSVLLTGQMRYMSDALFDVLMVSSEGPEVESLVKNEGCPHIAVSMTRKITPIQDLLALFRLWRLFLRERPQIVHSHTPKAGLLSMIAARLAGVPVCLHTVAGMPALAKDGVFRRVLLTIEAITCLAAHKVFPNSKELMNVIMRERICTPSKLCVIGNGSSNGIETSFFSRADDTVEQARGIRERHGIGPDSVVMCFVGRIVSDKGINELVRVFGRARNLNDKLVMLLVGSMESDLDPLEDDTMLALKLGHGIVLTGYQGDVRPFMCASDIFVFPSHREGFPNVVMQAACMELPIVATDINGCNEIVSHGESGLLVPVEDEEMLFSAIMDLVGSSEKRNVMGKRAREAVVGKYDRSFLHGEVLKEYRELLRLKGLEYPLVHE